MRSSVDLWPCGATQSHRLRLPPQSPVSLKHKEPPKFLAMQFPRLRSARRQVIAHRSHLHLDFGDMMLDNVAYRNDAH